MAVDPEAMAPVEMALGVDPEASRLVAGVVPQAETLMTPPRARPAWRDRSARTPARALRPQRTRDERAQTPRGRHTSFVRCEAVMELKPTSRARAASDLWSSHLICGLVGFTTVRDTRYPINPL